MKEPEHPQNIGNVKVPVGAPATGIFGVPATSDPYVGIGAYVSAPPKVIQ